MRHPSAPSVLYKERRKQFMEKMIPASVALFYSNDQMPRSGDQFYAFRQDPSLLALTGITQPGTILMLHRTASDRYDEYIFILPADPHHEVWHGERLKPSEAKRISGLSSIHVIEDWMKISPEVFNASSTIYMNTLPEDKPAPIIPLQNHRKAIEIRNAYPRHAMISSESILREMMMIKHPIEIDLIKKAVGITASGFHQALQQIRPGMKEYEVEAEITYVFARHGAIHAFEPIIASGKSACTLHYVSNHQSIGANDLILMDFGAEYAGMASDMSRTVPASGIFSDQQKRIYGSVLRVLKETMSLMRPGMTISELNKETGRLIESELITLGILSRQQINQQDPTAPLWKKYFMHGVSHHLGYDVHDIGDREAPFKPGMVLTCEPGLYIPEWEIGIRLENDILITESAPHNLMEGIPIEIAEIESAMGS